MKHRIIYIYVTMTAACCITSRAPFTVFLFLEFLSRDSAASDFVFWKKNTKAH